MTPKEKANKLCMRFLIETTTDIPYGINKTIAKECALIAVDEVLNAVMSVYQPETKRYYLEVKKEIEAL